MKSSIPLCLVIALGGLTIGLSQGAKAEETSSIMQKAQAFSADFDEPSKRHFTVIYSNYNILQVVEGVQASIGETVKACGKANPDMKDKMQDRFKIWEASVEPVMEEAEEHINNMIHAQEYAPAKSVEKFLKEVKKDREAHEKEVDKVPVSSPEACQHLLDTMGETQDNFKRLLQATLISMPQSIQQEMEKEKERERAEEAEAEAKAKSEAEAEAEAIKEGDEGAAAEAEATQE